LLLPVAAVGLVLQLLYGLALVGLIWLLWVPRGKHVLFVYSNSPLWQAHLEQRVLPRVTSQAVVLNWSARRGWTGRDWLAVAAFRYFGGHREFNPLGIVFRPWRRPRVFRFWKPYQALKHGRPAPLAEMEAAFLAAVGG
jgi:hypothetical protein